MLSHWAEILTPTQRDNRGSFIVIENLWWSKLAVRFRLSSKNGTHFATSRTPLPQPNSIQDMYFISLVHSISFGTLVFNNKKHQRKPQKRTNV